MFDCSVQWKEKERGKNKETCKFKFNKDCELETGKNVWNFKKLFLTKK